MLVREAIGDQLRLKRREQNLTLKYVAGIASISTGYLSEIERGQKEASSEVLQSICSSLGVSIAEVLVNSGFYLFSIDRATSTIDQSIVGLMAA